MPDTERYRTFIQGVPTPEAGFRYEDLFPYTLTLLSIGFSEKSTQPPLEFCPQGFAEIYAMREQLAAFNICMPRDSITQKTYSALLESTDNPEQVIINKHFGGSIAPNDRRFVIVPNDYPSAMPEGVGHLVMWYADENLPLGWVADKIAVHMKHLRLATGDFVAYTKPHHSESDHSGLFIPGIHRSIPGLPHIHILVRDPKLQTQSALEI